jgi:hypothetical protein
MSDDEFDDDQVAAVAAFHQQVDAITAETQRAIAAAGAQLLHERDRRRRAGQAR